MSSIVKSWDLPHPPAKVWRALTEPALVAQWLMETDLAPVQGKKFSFRQKAQPWWDGVVHSEILASDPPKRLSYAWATAPGQAAPQLDTIVTWTLTPIEGGTRLALEHTGFQPGNEQAFAGAKLGWDRNVGDSLAGLLKTFE